MNEAVPLATTENVLHPRQVVEFKDTKARLEAVLGAPDYIRKQLVDGGAGVTRQIGEVDKMLAQAPKPYAADELDAAVALEASLRADWLEGMPTQAEMRRNSPGCVDKNVAWNNRSKTKVLRWKQLKRRLHATGISEHRLADEGDISNIEMFRPAGGAQELSMDNAQIPVKAIMKMPPPGAGPAAVMSGEQAEALESISPEIYAKMAMLTNSQRGDILEIIDRELAGAGEAQEAPSRSGRPAKRAKAKRVKRPRSPAQLVSDERMRVLAKARNAARAAPKVGQEG